MKKLISIGVALALLTMAVVPGAVAAYEPPVTYAKVPFAILQSGFDLLAGLWPDLDTALAMEMPWLTGVFTNLGAWAGGPLSWTVDMLAWGVALVGDVLTAVPMITDMLPAGLDIPALTDAVACGLMTCWSDTLCSGNFTPCG